MRKPAFRVKNDTDLELVADPELRAMYTLSPYVWQEESQYELLVRAVPHAQDPAQKVARIYHGRSADGVRFRMDDKPDIAPGPDPEDRDGCEDPSATRFQGELCVFYTGWNQAQKTGRLMLASGPDPCSLRKRGVALDSTPSHLNPKEATIVQRSDGSWILFFEYARHGRSRIGRAQADRLGGPWRVGSDPFEASPAGWDSWHLSPGPLLEHDGSRFMFYNGATKDAAWRIGWVLFDDSLSAVIDRGPDPIIVPPPPHGDETDIAFAASAVIVLGETWLYYSIADKQMKRAVLRAA